MREAYDKKKDSPLVEWALEPTSVQFNITEFSMPGHDRIRVRPVAEGLAVYCDNRLVARMRVNGDDLTIQGKVTHQVSLDMGAE